MVRQTVLVDGTRRGSYGESGVTLIRDVAQRRANKRIGRDHTVYKD